MRRRGTSPQKKAGAPEDVTSGKPRGDKADSLLGEIVLALARVAARDADGPTAIVDDSSIPAGSSPNANKDTRRPGSRRTRVRTTEAKDVVVPDAEHEEATAPLTLREIANTINVSDDVARYLLRKKKIRGFKAGGQWRAMPQAITEYIIEQLSKG